MEEAHDRSGKNPCVPLRKVMSSCSCVSMACCFLPQAEKITGDQEGTFLVAGRDSSKIHKSDSLNSNVSVRKIIS